MSRSGEPPLPSETELAPGYRVIEHISRGRTLDVYDAWSDERATRCIVKALRPEHAGDAAAGRRLVAEGRLLKRLSHPHIVRGYEAFADPPLVVMETLTGQTLAHLIDEAPRRLGIQEIAHLGLHLGSAIRYLHGAGWLHLDLKPGNVVAEAGRAKLIDMSIARRPGRSAGGRGTWCYMAPEQATGGRLTAAADVWGLGAVLYEAVTGRAAFDPPTPEEEALLARLASTGSSRGDPEEWSTGETSTDPRDRHYPQLDGPPTPIRRLRRGVPAELIALLDACLELGAADRPSVDQLLSGLEPLAGLPPAAWRFSGA
jgi:eukaryotic-like serine/threonine-protein kinase